MRIQTHEDTAKELLIIDEILNYFNYPKDKTIPYIIALHILEYRALLEAVSEKEYEQCKQLAKELVEHLTDKVNKL